MKSDLVMFNRIILAHNLLKYACIQARLKDAHLTDYLFNKIWIWLTGQLVHLSDGLQNQTDR